MTAVLSATDRIIAEWLGDKDCYAWHGGYDPLGTQMDGTFDLVELASKITLAERTRCAKIVENWRDTSDGYSVCECQQQVAAKIRQGD